MTKHPDPLTEPGAFRMEAGELAMRFASGGRFRLVALLYARPTTHPPKTGGHWPLIVIAEHATDPGPAEVLIVIEGQTDAYGARPADLVVVIPVRSTHRSREALASAGKETR